MRDAAVVVKVKVFRGAFVGAHDANWKTAADGFAECEDVGFDVGMLVGEPFAGPTATGPDFIADEQEVVSIAEIAEAGQVSRVGDVHAAFALNGLDDDGDGFWVDFMLDGIEIVVGDVFKTGEVGGEAGADLVLSRGHHGRETSAMERLVGGDDLVSFVLAVESREFERGFVSIRPRVTEVGSTVETFLGDVLGESGLRFGVEKVADVPDFVHLVVGCGDEVGMAMTEDARAESGEEVGVGFACGVREGGA